MDWINYWQELKRRNVIKAGLAYLIIAWLITQVLSIVLPTFEAPPYILKSALIVILIGFPIWIVFSWIYEFTPEGIKKTIDIEPDLSMMPKTGSKLNKVIIFTLSLAVIILVIDRFINKPVQVLNLGEKSIAVLAFADMSPKKDHEYFSDGISEELLNILVKIPELKVISRTSSFSYKDKNLTATEIGEELKVSHILEGSIRKAGNTVRITAQLINTNDGSHIWSNTYDRNLDSIFKIQDEIAAEVSKQLELSILGKSERTYTPIIEAYNLYLQANHLTRQNTKESYLLAEEIIKKAIAIDSSYSDAWDLLGSIYNTGTHNFSIGENKESFSKGIEAVEKAIELDPNSADAYASLASLKGRIWKFEESARYMNRALELEPNNAVIIGTAALQTFGDIEKSVELIKKAIKLDPLVFTNYFNLGFSYYRLGHLEEAMEAFNKYTVYYPNSQILHYMKGQVLLAQGKKEEALEEFKQEKHEFFRSYGMNFILYVMGDESKSKAIFNEFLEKFSQTDPANTADLYAFRGDYEQAFVYLNRAFDIKDPVLMEALSYPSFKPMYKDPRWKTFIERIDLPKDYGYATE
ncbi:tetratricopeptide repeat protein [Flavobacteriaceae bacterium AH-315-B10]|nr:tetratricopeptide repeat protein [Flavobacteriaceae bacterium AH-315-B10]